MQCVNIIKSNKNAVMRVFIKKNYNNIKSVVRALALQTIYQQTFRHSWHQPFLYTSNVSSY